MSETATTHADVSVSGGKLIDRIDAVRKAADFATLHFDEDGIHINESIGFDSALVNITVPVTDHEDDSADVPESFKARTSMHHVVAMVEEVATRHDTVSFRYDYDSKSLYTYVGGPENTKEIDIEIPPTESTTEPPDIKREATASVMSNRLVGVAAGRKHDGSGDHTISVIGRDNELALARANGDDYVDEWVLPDDAVRSANAENGEVVTRVSAERLCAIVEGLPKSWNVDLAFGDDYPLYVRVAEDWEYWIAPRIVQEDDSQ